MGLRRQVTGIGRQGLGLPYFDCLGQDLGQERCGQNPTASLPLSSPGANRHLHSLAKQIFNLMKFDSYARFVKSPLYQECLLAEAEGRPLREPGSSHLGSPDTARKVRTGVAGGGMGRRLRTVSGRVFLRPRFLLGAGALLRTRVFPVSPEAKTEAWEVTTAGRGRVGAAATR